MTPDEEIAKKVEVYQGLAIEDPNIDVGLLAINALQTQSQNTVSTKAKRWCYLISISLPPVGLLIALKYYSFSDEKDAKQVAWVCILLTVVSLILFWFGAKLLFSTAGTTPAQIEQIKPSDIQQILQ